MLAAGRPRGRETPARVLRPWFDEQIQSGLLPMQTGNWCFVRRLHWPSLHRNQHRETEYTTKVVVGFNGQSSHDNNVLIRSGEALGIGWSRNMLYSGFSILPRSVVRRQTGFAARITRTLCGFRNSRQWRIEVIQWMRDGQLEHWPASQTAGRNRML